MVHLVATSSLPEFFLYKRLITEKRNVVYIRILSGNAPSYMNRYNCNKLCFTFTKGKLYQTQYYNELAIYKTGSMVAQEPSVIIAQRKQTPQNFKHVFESRKNMTAVLFEYHSEQSCRSFLIKTVFVSSIFTFSDHFSLSFSSNALFRN